MAKPNKRRNRKARRDGRQQMRHEVRQVGGVTIGRPMSDAEFAGSTSVPAGHGPKAPAGYGDALRAQVDQARDTEVRYPEIKDRSDDGDFCAIEFRDVPVGWHAGRIVHERRGMAQRSGTRAQRGRAYQHGIAGDRLASDRLQSFTVPETWTDDSVIRWYAHGMWVLSVLPAGHLFPADAKAQDIPVLRKEVESYGYGETEARELPDKEDIAVADRVIGWPGLLSDVSLRRAFMAMAGGATSSSVAKRLGYKGPQMGKIKAMEAAAMIAFALNCAELGIKRT